MENQSTPRNLLKHIGKSWWFNNNWSNGAYKARELPYSSLNGVDIFTPTYMEQAAKRVSLNIIQTLPNQSFPSKYQ